MPRNRHNFEAHFFPNEERYWSEKLVTDVNLVPLMPDEDKTKANVPVARCIFYVLWCFLCYLRRLFKDWFFRIAIQNNNM